MTRPHWVDYAIVTVFTVLSVLFMGLNLSSPVARALLRGERVTGIVIGSDYEQYARHSDTMMVASYDPASRFLDVLSIPRDTRVDLPEFPGIKRVNEIFTYQFKHSGRSFEAASLAIRDMAETLLSSGTAQRFEIPYYLTIDYGGFKALIDALGGVYVTVTEPMDYDDNWGKLHIHLKPGRQWLNGAEALKYVRFRGHKADQGRVMRQQVFVKEVLKRLKNPQTLWRLPEYLKVVLSGLHTNVSFWDIVTIAIESRRLSWSDTRMFSLPGHPVGNLWQMDPGDAQRIAHMMQIHTSQQVNEFPMSSEAATAKVGIAPTVEVWNASRHPNAARFVSRLLREKGFDVVKYGPFGSTSTRTWVMDRSGRLRPAQAVAEILAPLNPEVVSRLDTARQVDVRVIIGDDFPDNPEQRWKF